MILFWRPNGTAGPPTAFSIGVGLVNAWMAGSSTPSVFVQTPVEIVVPARASRLTIQPRAAIIVAPPHK